MLEPDQWKSVLGSITGTLYRGTERVSTAHCLDLLEVGPDPVLRQRAAKRLQSFAALALALISLITRWNSPRASNTCTLSGGLASTRLPTSATSQER